MPDLIYKIFRLEEWVEFQKMKIYIGSEDDQRDGFIHFSARDQLYGTLIKHYRTVAQIVIGKVKTADLSEHLKWEKSRSGALFPHLYNPLPLDRLIEHIELRQNLIGEFELPIDF